MKHSSIRILLALVAQFNMELVQMDVKTAFLHGDLEEEIYITQLDGFKVTGKENWVCKLSKSLYGLKQSPRQWYKRFDQFMIGQNYTRRSFDHCVYFRKLQDGSFIMLIASRNQGEICRLKAQLSKEFEMKYLGEAKKILGMEIARDGQRGAIHLAKNQVYHAKCAPLSVSRYFHAENLLGFTQIFHFDLLAQLSLQSAYLPLIP